MLKDKCYLYVEDDAPSRLLFQKLMKMQDVTRFAMFEDSTDFMDRFKALNERPDVVLLDIHMKPHSGFDLLKMLRADPDSATLTIVALTASVMNQEIELLRTSGFNGVISKPLRLSLFPSLLERIAGGEAVWEVV